MNTRFFFVAGWTVLLHTGTAIAQPQAPRQPPTPAAGRSLELVTLQQAAIDTDPRAREVQLLASQSDLRLRNISVGRLPSVTVEGQAQYQSDVPRAPFRLPR